MKVKELMTENICSVLPSAEARAVAQQMKKLDVGIIPVCSDRGVPKGVITDRDIALRVLAAGKNSDIKALDIMSQNIISIDKEASIHDAALIMAKNKIRRIIVTDGDTLIGVLSLGDIASKKILLDEAGDALGAISKKETTS